MQEIKYVTGYCPERNEEVTIQVFYTSGAALPTGMKCEYHSGYRVCNYFLKTGKCPIAKGM